MKIRIGARTDGWAGNRRGGWRAGSARRGNRAASLVSIHADTPLGTHEFSPAPHRAPSHPTAGFGASTGLAVPPGAPVPCVADDTIVRLLTEIRALVAGLPQPAQPVLLDDLYVTESCLRDVPTRQRDTGLIGRLFDRIDAVFRRVHGTAGPLPELVALATAAGFSWGDPTG